MPKTDQGAAEARLAIAAEIERKADPLGARNFATFCFRREEWLMIAAALRAQPERGAEEMRERCAVLVEADRRTAMAKETGYFPRWQGYALELAAAIRALPLTPADDDGAGR